MRLPTRVLTCSLLTGAALLAQSALADVVFDNSVNDLSVNFNTSTLEVGDDIVLGGTARFLTNFAVQYYLLTPNGSEQIDIKLYKNDGAPNIDGTHNPGTLLYDSGSFAVPGTSRQTIDFDQTTLGGGFAVPDELTWSVQFTGLGGGDDAGVTLYNPPTVGTDPHDYWQNNSGTWTWMTNSVNPVNFAAKFEASVPEPASASVILLGGLGGVFGLFLKRRSMNRKA